MRRYLPPLAWAALVPLSSFAQVNAPDAPQRPALPMTLQQVQEAAFARHPDLVAAAHEVEAAEAARQQAGARPNPTLSAEVEDTRRATRNTTLLLSQPFELGGKRAARLGLAERAHEVALADVAIRRADVRAAATSAFFDTLIAQERERLAEASLQLSQRGSQAVRNRVTAGKVSPIEDTRARLLEAGVQMELLRARSELATARQRLGSALAQPELLVQAVENVALTLPPSVTGAAFEPLLQQAPATQRAEAEAARAAAQVEVERSRQTPDVTLSLGARREADTQRQMAVVGVSIPLPLFDTHRGAVLEAQRRADKAQAELQSTRLRLALEARVAAEQLRAARAEAELLSSDMLPGAQNAYDATVTGYELGKFGLTEVLDAQRSLLQAKSQYIQSLSSAHRAAADLERLIGKPVNPTLAK